MLMTVVIAMAAGCVLIVLARRLNVPSIVLLLLAGIVLGPVDYVGLNIVKPEILGDGLLVIVSLAVGLILFEGGLTLDPSGYRSAPKMIKRLLSIGVVVTWFGTAGAIRLISRAPWEQCFMAGSLVIVTGPTVIAPLLKRIRVNARLHSILHWEGVLIDPIGVFIALLCYEWIINRDAQDAFTNLAIRVGGGIAAGVAGGLFIAWVLKRKKVPEELINIFVLGMALATFGAAEAMMSEAGLLAVTVAGFVVGLTGSARLKKIREFKGEITELLIGTLFILLAARLSLDQFQVFGLAGALAVAVVMLVIRPLNIAVCSVGVDLTRRERLFLAWVAPRGIVAASMASLVSINFAQRNATGGGGEAVQGIADPMYVETFTYSVIIATIVLQGLTASPMAALLKVKRSDPTGWLIVGAHALGRSVAEFLSGAA